MDDDKKQEPVNSSDPNNINLDIDKEDTAVDSKPSESAPSQSDKPVAEEKTPVLPSEPAVPESSQTPQAAIFPKKENWLKRFLRTKKGKVTAVIVALLVVAGALFAIPATRYGILGTFIKRDASLVVIDNKTKKPVSQATVEMGSLSAKTDTDGKVRLSDVPVGEYAVKITKKHYKDVTGTYTVPIFSTPSEATVDFEATGRQVTVLLTNLITKQPVADASITIDDVSSTANDKGEANIVLPADKQTVKATIKHADYNEAIVDIKVTDQADANQIPLTPSGVVYYLSKATGKINVMKANLDGSSASVVVAATGSESDKDTALLASRDWKYMVLSAKRKSDVASQLYVIDARTDSLKAVDEGNVEVTLAGWSGHNFLYIVTRNDKQEWEDKRQALKSYNAETGKLTVIDETSGTGTNYMNMEAESFGKPYIIENKVVYIKNVGRGTALGTPHTKKPAVLVVNPDGSQLQRVKEFDYTSSGFLDAKLYEPQEVYFRYSHDAAPTEFYEYEAGSVKSITNDDNKFYNTFYPTYLVSPDGQKTFWDEPRNGKNALFIGDKNGSNDKEVSQQSEYKAYGWYSDRYVLVSKGGSELYVASADQPWDTPVKITNYHKPVISFEGYGYGYGGF